MPTARIRTRDRSLTRRELYRLSYVGDCRSGSCALHGRTDCSRMVDRAGFQPATLGVQNQRSGIWSYRPARIISARTMFAKNGRQPLTHHFWRHHFPDDSNVDHESGVLHIRLTAPAILLLGYATPYPFSFPLISLSAMLTPVIPKSILELLLNVVRNIDPRWNSGKLEHALRIHQIPHAAATLRSESFAATLSRWEKCCAIHSSNSAMVRNTR